MKAIILCAGYATRLYPLTINKPKHLLEIKGRPILDYIIDKIPKNMEIILVTNDKFYNNFENWTNKQERKIKVLNDGTLSNEDRLGGIGDLYFVIQKEKINEDIFVILGDNLSDFDLGKFIDFFNKNKKTSLGVFEFKHTDLTKMGVVEAKDNKMISFEEKPKIPKSNLASTGFYIFTKNDLNNIKEYMKTDKPKDAPGFLIKDFFDNGEEIDVFTFTGRWYDIGNKEIYEEVNKIW